MRIDGLTPNQNRPIGESRPQTIEPLTLTKGQVISATVMGQEGDVMLLQTLDGRPFTARMGSEALLAQGDMVECMVTGDGEQPQLQLLGVTRGGQTAQAPSMLTVGENALLESAGLLGDTRAAQVMLALRDTDIRPSVQLVQEAVALMESGNLDAKGALFFLSNEIEPTAENVQIFQLLEEGTTLGPQLYEFMLDVLSGESQEPQALLEQLTALVQPQENGEGAVVPSQIQGEMGVEAAPQQPLLESVVQGFIADGAAELESQPANTTGEGTGILGENGTAQGMQNAAEQPVLVEISDRDAGMATPASAQGEPVAEIGQGLAAQTETAQVPLAGENKGIQGQTVMPADAGTVPLAEEESAPATVVTTEAAGEATPDLPMETVDAGQAQQAVPRTPMELTQRLISMFLKMDREVDGQEVKRVVQNTSQLDLLREALEETGLLSRQGLSGRMEEMAAQTRFTQDISRFYMAQIPIQGQLAETAELYVLKQKQKNKGIDPEDTAILIALNTQNMGRVETLIRVDKRSLSLHFKVEAAEVISRFQEETTKLYNAMGDLGYTLTEAKVQPLTTRTTPKVAQETLLRTVERPRVYVDCRI
ncbi:flagellar hook-length control protein FliK [Eubacteriales bacterium OttesenSCG-928-M02]|nr:flagellar hook-length control protein FliK [Eubacteriales bacterium OttesenSCG-928-M02]